MEDLKNRLVRNNERFAEECSQGWRGTSQGWRDALFAHLSEVAYLEGAGGEMLLRQLGCDRYAFLEKDGAQGHIASSVDRVIILFRGTEPKELNEEMERASQRPAQPPRSKSSYNDLKADLKAFHWPSRTGGHVARGFQQEVEKLWAGGEIEAWPMEGKDVIVAGHSLGGAMATLCAARLKERVGASRLQLYTYGSPRAGTPKFCRGHRDLFHRRFRNGTDIIAGLPPWWLGWGHHGRMCLLCSDGRVREAMPRYKVYWDEVRHVAVSWGKGRPGAHRFLNHLAGKYADKLWFAYVDQVESSRAAAAADLGGDGEAPRARPAVQLLKIRSDHQADVAAVLVARNQKGDLLLRQEEKIRELESEVGGLRAWSAAVEREAASAGCDLPALRRTHDHPRPALGQHGIAHSVPTGGAAAGELEGGPGEGGAPAKLAAWAAMSDEVIIMTKGGGGEWGGPGACGESAVKPGYVAEKGLQQGGAGAGGGARGPGGPAEGAAPGEI